MQRHIKNYKEKAEKCIVCGVSISLPKRRYCCKRCKVIYDCKQRSKKPQTKDCKQCGVEFKPYTSLDKFCSPQCRINNMKSKRTWNWKDVSKKMGKKNAAYVHGLRVQGDHSESSNGLKEFRRNRDVYRQALIDEHGYLFCERCGATNTKFEAHHIIYRSEKPNHEYLHSKANILNLCVKCHNWFHMWKGRRNGIVIERGLHLLFGDDVLDKRLPELELPIDLKHTQLNLFR